MVDMVARHLLKLRARGHVTASDEATIRALISEQQDYPANLTIIQRGDLRNHSTLLLDGIMSRYIDLRNGERQITHVHVAGDFADLHSFPLKHLDHSIMTLTPCRVAIVPHDRIYELTEASPSLTRLCWLATNLDAAIHRQWEVSLGRRQAASRAAHFFCEIHLRLKVVGLADDDGYELPITQYILSQCLGLTPVHVNRTLRELRERKLMTFRHGRVIIEDLPGLILLAEFNPIYLYLDT